MGSPPTRRRPRRPTTHDSVSMRRCAWRAASWRLDGALRGGCDRWDVHPRMRVPSCWSPMRALSLSAAFGWSAVACIESRCCEHDTRHCTHATVANKLRYLVKHPEDKYYYPVKK